MVFKPIKSATISLESPEAMFRDLRRRTIPAPHAHQADVLRSYVRIAQEHKDVALQLPTGSGKTLVGLLIGEWRRRKNGERIVYLCPTNQLVYQVVEQATMKYGIDAHAFTGKKAEYPAKEKGEYLNSETIAVTSYNGLFNTRPFFTNPHLIILDDAHAAENYIASFWSLRVERFRGEHAALFTALVNVLGQTLSPIDMQRLVGPWNDSWDKTWVDKIPTPTFSRLGPELASVIESHVQGTDLHFPWQTIREQLNGCQLYVGSSEILIRPLIPPSMQHPPFARATQRLYMSATLGEGGDLERVTGVPSIHRLPAPEGWDKQGVGRRLFLFPGRSLSDSEEEDLQAKMIKKAGRALVLVPDERTAISYREWVTKRLKCPVFDAKQIEASKQPFVSSPFAVAVVANRYDGIDFPQNECRLLIAEGLPRATNLQERFLVARMGAIVLLNDRILTRVVQAFGRCTRDATDYAAVVVWGDELFAYLTTRERRTFLHPEIQAELEFGLQQSKDVGPVEFISYLTALLDQTQDWNAADASIIALRGNAVQGKLPGTDELRASVLHEVTYQYALWQGKYLDALEAARKVLEKLQSPELRGYRALWLYLAGAAAWWASVVGMGSLDSQAREYFRKASDAAFSVKWLSSLAHGSEPSVDASEQALLFAVIERLEVQLTKLGTVHDLKFATEEAFILQNLAQPEKEKFEPAHERLGRLLGYEAGNRESTGSPDPWWIADETFCFIFEDHSNATSEVLDVTKARQVGTHPNWARENLPLAKSPTVLPVLISPVTRADTDALPHLRNVVFWRLDAFRQWARSAMMVVRELRRTFPGSGDLEWRARAQQRYKDARLDPKGLATMLEASPAREVLK